MSAALRSSVRILNRHTLCVFAEGLRSQIADDAPESWPTQGRIDVARVRLRHPVCVSGQGDLITPIVCSERGFALPLTILVVTVMTMLIASANVRARVDRIIAESSGATVDAFAVAQSGLNRYIAYYDSVTPKVRPPDGDSVRINVPSGFAVVRAYKVRTPTDTMEMELYIVRSTGYLIEATRGSIPQAQRTVAQFAQWQSAAMWIESVFTAANDWVIGPSTDVDVRGNDHCSPAVPTVTGVRTSAASTLVPADFDDITSLILSGTGSDAANSTRIDWASIVGGQFEAEYDSYQAWDASYPTMLITGDTTINNFGGWGLLIVTGNLTLTGDVLNWGGVVLVGGRLTVDVAAGVYGYFRGVTATGLNAQLGMSPPANLISGGSLIDFDYHSCEVQKALNTFIGFVPIRNAWIDNWAMY